MTTETVSKQERIEELKAKLATLTPEIQEIEKELLALDRKDAITTYAEKFGLKAAIDEFSHEYVATAYGLKP